MQEIFTQAFELHKRGEFKQAIFLYNRLLNLNPEDQTLLFLLSDAYLREDFNGLAVNLLKNLLNNNPKHPEAWCNLGTAYRKENNYDKAEECWKKSIEIAGDTVETCGNMASLYADSGRPDDALVWTKRALKIDPDNTQANWQKALAFLSKGDWAKGWPAYEYRFKLDQWDSRDSIKAPKWDGKPTNHLYVHGEQGVGDEILFLSCLNDAMPLCDKVTVEVNRKVADLVRLTWPNVNVVTEEAQGEYSAKIALGSLCSFFRANERFFSGDAYLTPDQARIEYYKAKLKEIGEGPYIGLAWLGGLKSTGLTRRSIPIKEFKPLMEKYTCVSVQYEDTNPILSVERENAGLVKINDLCVGGDLAEQAALMAALDAVVTVQQTAVHVAGAIGAKCYVLVPELTSWQFARDVFPWYKSVKLFRRKGETWPFNQLMETLDADLA